MPGVVTGVVVRVRVCSGFLAAAEEGSIMTIHFPLPAMDHQFLSIRQAAERYSVSEVTLRRLAREVTRDERHELREYVRPGQAELDRLRSENKPFEYELSTKLLGLRYQLQSQSPEEGSPVIEDARADIGSAATKVLESTNELLREQLKVKDDQIRQLNDSLRAMQQQQNATTAVLVRLSERIPLLSGPEPQRADAVNVDAKERKTPAAEKQPTKKHPKAHPTPAQSGGVFSRWFRRAPATAGAGK